MLTVCRGAQARFGILHEFRNSCAILTVVPWEVFCVRLFGQSICQFQGGCPIGAIPKSILGALGRLEFQTPGRPGQTKDFFPRTVYEQLAVIQHSDLIAEIFHPLEFMAGVENRTVLTLDIRTQELRDAIDGVRVGGTQRFVHHQERRFVQHAACDVQSLAFSRRQGLKRSIQQGLGDSERLAELPHTILNRGVIQSAQLAKQAQVVTPGQPWIKRGVHPPHRVLRVLGPLSRDDVKSKPASSTEPRSAVSVPVKRRASVVLPAPLFPKSPTIRPTGISKSMFSSAQAVKPDRAKLFPTPVMRARAAGVCWGLEGVTGRGKGPGKVRAPGDSV